MLTQIADKNRIRAPSLTNGLSRVSEAIFGVKPAVLSNAPFPLDPLSAAELETATAAVKKHVASELIPGTPLRFNIVTLKEPPKIAQLAFLKGAPPPPRIAFCVIQVPLPGVGYVYEADVELSAQPVQVIGWRKRDGVQPMVTVDDTIEAEAIFKADVNVQRLVRELYGIHDVEEIACDPWYYGARFLEPGQPALDGRLIQCFLYTRTPGMAQDNHYAHPLDMVVNLDMNSRKVTNIWHQKGKTFVVPRLNANYHRDLIEKPLRTGLKPLHVVQPEGPSFNVTGNNVEWQQWHFHVGFNYREGLVLSHIGYEDAGRIRPVLHRASTVEIIVPYGDPRPPFHRKCAFDALDYGLGASANSLELGCDCLGAIKYFDGVMTAGSGEAMVIKKAVCMHEEDYGILWKHTEYRTDHLETRRSRRLVISFFCTIANYEYGFFWYLYQDGTIQHEVKLTGILSTNGMSEGEDPANPGYGQIMAPHLNAQIHQHFFQIRLDFAVDDDNGGKDLVLTEMNMVPMAEGPENPYNVGFTANETLIRTEQEAIRMANVETSRYWKIKNLNSINPLTGKPVAWKLVPAVSAPLYANPKSDHARRGAFATKHVWVTPFAEDEFYPAGNYPLEPNPIGLKDWTNKNRSLVGQDLVVWHTMGVTHIPRIEDYPVMPCEYASFFLKPANFFDMNPGINLPATRDVASVELSCCTGAGAMTRADEVHHKQHDLAKHDCCGRAGQEGCTCAPGCQCVCDKARAEAPAARL